MIKSRKLRCAGHEAIMEECWSVLKILTGKTTGKRSLGSPRHRLEHDVGMDLKEIGANSRNWVDSAQDGDY